MTPYAYACTCGEIFGHVWPYTLHLLYLAHCLDCGRRLDTEAERTRGHHRQCLQVRSVA